MPRFRQLKECKFWQVQDATYFWTGPKGAKGMSELWNRYCKTDVKVIQIDPTWHDLDEYCPAGVIGEYIYAFNPNDVVYTFKDCIIKDKRNA